MNPTPPPAPTNGVAVLMAEIERIAQELRAYNKRPLPATEDQLKALLTLAERERPLTVKVNSEAVAERLTKSLVNEVAEQAQTFQQTGYKLINYLDERQKTMSAALTQGVDAVQAAEARLQASAQQIPRSVPLNVLENWRSTLGFTLGPVLLVLLGMLLSGQFSRVPKAELERVQAELAQAQGAVERFRECRATLVKERPELAYQYFPYANDPAPAKSKKARK